MTSRFTPTVKSAKVSAAKCSTPSTSSSSTTTPIKPARATLSTTKKLSAVTRPMLVKQTSACDLRERLRLNQNDDVLNKAFTASSPFTTKFTTKGKLTTPNTMSASSSSLSSATSATKNVFGTYSSTNLGAKRLFGNSTPTVTRTPSAPVISTPDCFSKVLLETQTPQKPKRSCETPQSYRKSNELGDESKSKDEESNLTVAVRVRPMNAKECTTPQVTRVVTVKNTYEVLVKSGMNVESYAYDNVFCSYDADDTENYADQETVFNGTALPLIDKAFEGYNTCLFAYGQTGSGKSYSMMGIDTDHSKPNREAGIIPRFCYELFRRIDEMKDQFTAQVEVSYFEIYNEKIHDLLAVTPTHLINATPGNQSKRQALQVREHPQWGPYIENLNIHPVDSNIALKNWMAVGNSQRATAATGMNDKSSRSHSIFSIILTLSEIDSESKVTTTKRSRINLVDLAGSERVNHTSASGERLKEGVKINSSLLILGRVINALADPKKNTFVPYRDSVLTFLLKESLGGNSRTAMLATISPASLHVDETLATLRYACQARSIVNRVKVNKDLNNREIHELRTEIERLRAQVQYYKRQEIQAIEAPPRKIIIETIEANPNDEEEKERLRQQLREKEHELANAQKSWRERLREANNKCKNEMKLLQQNGLALQLSDAQKSQPCLINLATDPMLSGTLLYILPPGVVKIGKPKPSHHPQSDIVLDGLWVGLNHCQIENRRGKLFIRPDMEECETFVNGELIQNERQIFHGDRIAIGRSHYFRVLNPKCSNNAQTEVVDYQAAHEEILREEKKRIEQELMIAQQEAIRQIEEERIKHELDYKEKVAQLELELFRFKCSKELMEAEKEVLERNEKEESEFVYRPIESDLCEKIKRMMERPTEEGMHETQMMVKEATQRCRNLGLNYEFVQTLVADESEVFKAVIKIIDRRNNRYAEWPTARLSVWLDLMRDNTDVTAENAFDSVDISWSENTEEMAMNESLNSSRISLNLSAMKETLLGKPIKSCFKTIQNKLSPWSSKGKSNISASADSNQLPIAVVTNLEKSSNSESVQSLLKTKKRLSYDDLDEVDENTHEKPKKPFSSLESGVSTSTPVEEKFDVQAQKYLSDLRKTTIRMKKLCHNKFNENVDVKGQTASAKIFQNLEEIEYLTNQIRHLIKNTEPTPQKTPKSVRFRLD